MTGLRGSSNAGKQKWWRKNVLPREASSLPPPSLFLNLYHAFHCPHNCRGRLSSLWPIIKSVSSRNWRCSDISILSLVQRGGGNITKCLVHQNQRDGGGNFFFFFKTHISVCVRAPAGNTQYKLITMFPLYSFGLAGSLLQGAASAVQI